MFVSGTDEIGCCLYFPDNARDNFFIFTRLYGSEDFVTFFERDDSGKKSAEKGKKTENMLLKEMKENTINRINKLHVLKQHLQQENILLGKITVSCFICVDTAQNNHKKLDSILEDIFSSVSNSLKNDFKDIVYHKVLYQSHDEVFVAESCELIKNEIEKAEESSKKKGKDVGGSSSLIDHVTKLVPDSWLEGTNVCVH